MFLASITKALQADQDEDTSALDEQRKAKLSEEHNSIIESYKELIRDQVSADFFDLIDSVESPNHFLNKQQSMATMALFQIFSPSPPGRTTWPNDI